MIDRILGDSLAFAARALYCSHSTEPENGALLLLATAEAYEKGLERPLLLGGGLRGPSLWKDTSGALGWLPWPLSVTGEMMDLVDSLFASGARGDRS